MYQTGVNTRTLTSTVGTVETELEASIQDQDQHMGVYDLDLEGGGNSRTAHTAFQHNRKSKPSTRVRVIVKTTHTRYQRLRILLRDTYNARELAWDKATGTGTKRLAGTNQGVERSYLLFRWERRSLYPLYLRSSRTGLCVRICLYSRAFRVPGRG